MASLWSRITGLFSRRKTSSASNPYHDLRNQVLKLKPEVLGPDGAGHILAVLMETGYPEAVATLVAVADGTVSLYFSNGGGLIGLGGHEGPRAAGLRLIAAAGSYLASLSPATSHPLPSRGMTQFIVVTRKGNLVVGAPEQDLGMNRHPLSPLFHAAQEVITEARLSSEKRSMGR